MIDFQDHSRKENVVAFINEIRDQNPGKTIRIVLDNFRSHHSKLVAETAELLDIQLIFLPPYSPDLNPIEFIWKSVKRIVSINSEEDLKDLVREGFLELSAKLTFAKKFRFDHEKIVFVSIIMLVINYNNVSLSNFTREVLNNRCFTEWLKKIKSELLLFSLFHLEPKHCSHSHNNCSNSHYFINFAGRER